MTKPGKELYHDLTRIEEYLGPICQFYSHKEFKISFKEPYINKFRRKWFFYDEYRQQPNQSHIFLYSFDGLAKYFMAKSTINLLLNLDGIHPFYAYIRLILKLGKIF